MSSKGEEAAFGRRQRVVPRLRQAAYVGLSRRTVAGGLLNGKAPDQEPPAPHADHLLVSPAPRTSQELSDLAARINFYLPDARVPVVVPRDPSLEVRPDAAPWMDPELVREPAWLTEAPGAHPHHLVTRLTPGTAGRIATAGRASSLAAPDFYYVADLGWLWVRWHFASMVSRSAPAAVERLFALGGPGTRALALATGPSARSLDPTTVDAEVRISCNSVVKDLELLRALKPNVICFMDPVFHYGPSRYAAAFRRDLLRAVDETDALLVTSELFAGVLLAHHPELTDRTIVLRVTKDKGPWRWPARDALSVRMTGNVLTNLMLPVGFALADEVQIAGCDGRNPDENYFWKHNQRTQYSDELMRSAFDTHPAFFRDRDYADYYEDHCRQVEDLLATAEAQGKRAVGVTPSHIPALRKRGAPAFVD